MPNARDLVIRWGLSIACPVLVVGLALVLEFRLMTQTVMFLEDRVSLERYLDGTVNRPFAFRVLIPETIRFLNRVTPSKLASALESRGEPIGRLLLPKNLSDKAKPLNYYFLVLIQLLSLFGYAIMGHRLYCRLFPVTAFHWLIPVGFLAVLVPIIAGRFGHIYDFTSLFFTTALLYAIAVHRHGLYLTLFAISCFNKETTVLATVAYAAYFVDRMPRRKYVLMVAAQAIIFLSIYFSLRCHFAANPGRDMEVWVFKQIDWLFGRTFSDYMCFLAVVFLVGFRFSEKPLVMRRAMWIVVVNAGLFLWGANSGELRNFYESVPLLTLFVLRNLGLMASLCVAWPKTSV